MCGLKRRRAGERIRTRRRGTGKERDEPFWTSGKEPCFCGLGMANAPSGFVPWRRTDDWMRAKG